MDKNGACDPIRIHSRRRNCVAQHTGDPVDAAQCRLRYNAQDRELEVDECSRTCQQQPAQPLQTGDSHIMSDAPSVIGPLTAPSVLLASHDAFLSPNSPLLGGLSSSAPKMSAITANNNNGQKEPYEPSSSPQPQPQPSSSASPSPSSGSDSVSSPSFDEVTASGGTVGDSSLAPQLLEPQMSCSNCTSDEICLLLVQQKVPFCAKVKDRTDSSGCGGWCKTPGQVCQSVGSKAFKCIHDSECVAEEWRCHDSLCIPLSKRCDGHYNCFDNSDEHDCPM